MGFAHAPFIQIKMAVSDQSSSPQKKRFRARVAYDGTNYNGWQFQPQGATIQAELEKAITKKVGSHVRVVGASRTDSGVHARGQGVHFDVSYERAAKELMDIQKFEFTLNRMLPRDIRVTRVGEAPGYDDNNREHKMDILPSGPRGSTRPWHSIYCSTGKLYTYRFSVGDVLDPMQRLYRHHEWRASKKSFSDLLLRDAASKFVGVHDFSAFTNTSIAPNGLTASVLVNPIRTIRSADVIDEGGGMYRIEFRIDGAMYRMIRNVMGTILNVACGALDVDGIDEVFASRDRRNAPKSAPAHGLCLEEVFYEDWEL